MSIKLKAQALLNTIKSVKEQIDDAQKTLVGTEQQLEALYRQCKHHWGEPKYTPIKREGYRTEGDPPGTMGIDWRGPIYITPETIEQWTRECVECGKVEVTQRKKEKKTYEPDFG